jgi:DNA-directed RNA polymerase specialized sigma24 family protein
VRPRCRTASWQPCCRAFPAHPSSRPVLAGEGALAHAPAPDAADAGLLRHEADARRALDEAALREALERLPARDRVVFRMRFWEGLTVAQIARGLGVPQKGLYRRIDRALARMRRELERGGVTLRACVSWWTRRAREAAGGRQSRRASP